MKYANENHEGVLFSNTWNQETNFPNLRMDMKYTSKNTLH